MKWLRRWMLSILVLGLASEAELDASTPIAFFTNVSARLLQAEFGLQSDQIQIYPTNQYTPAVHRLLQVAANLWETTSNATPLFPTVFCPRFGTNEGAVYLTGYEVVTNYNELEVWPLVNLETVPDPIGAIPPDSRVLVFGVPPILGAKKGLPNFNEFAMELLCTFSRRVQLRKAGSVLTETNQFFTLELALPMATEFWNSYATNYPGPVSIFVTNYTSVTLTNDLGVRLAQSFVTGDVITTNDWQAFNVFHASGDRDSFITFKRTNFSVLPPVGYLPNLGSSGFVSVTNTMVWDTSQQLLMPRWGIAISNQLHAMILAEPGREIIDYVILNGLNYQTNLTDIIAPGSAGTGNSFEQLWATNEIGGLVSGRMGVIQQINISLGSEGIPPPSTWRSYGLFTPGTPQAAIIAFQQFYFTPISNGYFNVPFTPYVQFRVPLSWQANDPLVNDMAGLLFDRERSAFVDQIRPPMSNPTPKLMNIGYVNRRYHPWAIDPSVAGADPDAFNISMKDPMVRSSDEWDFPANAPLEIESLGQIHRGTPWQTLYLKSSDLGLTNIFATPQQWATFAGITDAAERWMSWAGTTSVTDGFYTRPVRDWNVLSTLVALLNTNRPHDLLSVNDSNSEHWLAVLDGLAVWTNVSTELSLALGQLPEFDILLLNSNSPPATDLIPAIDMTRARQAGKVFRSIGELLAVPELSLNAPWLNQATTFQVTRGITDEAYEKLPSQLLSRVRADSVGRVELGGDSVRMSFTGFDDYPYAVQISSNLCGWASISTNYPSNGTFYLNVPLASSNQIFYRSELLP